MTGSILLSPVPYHIISYGTLLGTSFFHSFVNGPAMFKIVERPVFSAVQTKLFPIYFGLQTILSAVVALTFPGNTLAGISSGVSGLLDASNRWHSLAPIATMLASGLVNLTILLPATKKAMKARRGQAKRDGKEWYEPGPHSDEMRALNKKFGTLHGISSLLNLATFVSAIGYGFTLGYRLQSVVDKI